MSSKQPQASSADLKTTLIQLDELAKEAGRKIAAASSSAALEQIRVEVFGKKGLMSDLLSRLKDFQADDRRQIGQVANQHRDRLTTALEEKALEIQKQEWRRALEKDAMDASLPGQFFLKGALHPVRIVMSQAIRILQQAGLEPVFGPEIEFEDANFDRLNFQQQHAARDMQATFFVDETKARKPDWVQNSKLVLRTHTSPVQVRVLLEHLRQKSENELPLRIQAPGRVYRVDDDATHSPMFHQIEALVVDQSSGMSDLYAVLEYFCRKLFEDESLKIRFRPSYFPFTEPSAEVDISAQFLKKKSNQVEWLEVGGAGLVHPQVFRLCGWDPEKIQGWAFGLGVERLAMLKLGIPDLRWFFENRLSFLRSSGGLIG